METKSKRPGSITFLLAGLILFSTAGIVVFLPILSCPMDRFIEYTDWRCSFCDGRTRITLFQRWKNGPAPTAAEWEGMKLDSIEGKGFEKTSFRHALDLAGVFGGLPFTNQMRISAARTLLATGCYEKVIVRGEVRRQCAVDAVKDGVTAGVTILVVERAGDLQLPKKQ